MLQMTDIILDEEMGAVPFVIYREHREIVDGETEEDGVEEIVTSGVVHPTREAELEMVPEEYRYETLCSFYSPVGFSLGSRDGDTRYTAPDRIHYEGKEYRVIAVKNWQRFGFSKAIAVEKEGI